jgi:hypothetical protein
MTPRTGAWAQLVNREDSAEYVELCSEAMTEIQHAERGKALRSAATSVANMADAGYSIQSIVACLDRAGKYLEEMEGSKSITEATRVSREGMSGS